MTTSRGCTPRSEHGAFGRPRSTGRQACRSRAGWHQALVARLRRRRVTAITAPAHLVCGIVQLSDVGLFRSPFLAPPALGVFAVTMPAWRSSSLCAASRLADFLRMPCSMRSGIFWPFSLRAPNATTCASRTPSLPCPRAATRPARSPPSAGGELGAEGCGLAQGLAVDTALGLCLPHRPSPQAGARNACRVSRAWLERESPQHSLKAERRARRRRRLKPTLLKIASMSDDSSALRSARSCSALM